MGDSSGESDDSSKDSDCCHNSKGARAKDIVHKCNSDPGGITQKQSAIIRSIRYPSGSNTRKCVLTLDGYSYVIGE